MFTVTIGLVLCSIGLSPVLGNDCLAKDYGNGGTVCVCNADHCDTIPPVERPVVENAYLIYTSNKAGLRFNIASGTFIHSNMTSENKIVINQNETYQEIFGWGGALTDAAGINANSLDSGAREKLMRSYFSEDGIEYNLCRVPIGATDFSTSGYSYVDETQEDVHLTTFALRNEDFQLKIPFIREALKLTNNNLRLFASAWIAPKWMKTNGAYSGMLGYLKDEMYQPWANYFLKFLESYDEQNISFWGITTGNEPSLAFLPGQIPSVAWTASQMSKWIVNNLGPTIRNSPYSNISIMALDDQRLLLPWYVESMFQNEDVKNYIDGIAVHWYWDKIFSVSKLTQTHDKYPEKFILATEACTGNANQVHVELGSWSRGEEYAHSIIEDLNHWVTGWIDWSMALDLTGGPTYINNNVDSPIIVNATGNEFYKQPMFYAIGHFSKFVPRGSVRISFSQFADDVQATVLRRPDGGVVVVILNESNSEVPVVIADETKGEININITAHSFTTILYW